MNSGRKPRTPKVILKTSAVLLTWVLAGTTGFKKERKKKGIKEGGTDGGKKEGRKEVWADRREGGEKKGKEGGRK